jgi:hypothetical protein
MVDPGAAPAVAATLSRLQLATEDPNRSVKICPAGAWRGAGLGLHARQTGDAV